jgi:3-hydroxyacyl-[acyl-carrier-protein] dehydratase
MLAPVGLRRAGSFRVPADHPSLRGHFPGRPVVPGVVVLDMALATIMAQLPGMTLAGLASVKFTAIVPPDQEVEVHYHEAGDGKIGFTCTCNGAIAVQGSAQIQGAR